MPIVIIVIRYIVRCFSVEKVEDSRKMIERLKTFALLYQLIIERIKMSGLKEADKYSLS